MNVPALLHETAGWLVLEKPAGMHTVSRPGDDAMTVESWLRRERPEHAALEEAGLVHRLDHGTSGCLLVARTPDERIRLRGRISEESIRKNYQALVEGPIDDDGRFTLYFSSRYKRSRKVTTRPAGSERDRGRCAWWTLERDGDRRLVEIELIGAGRRHQIRAGFAHLGAPLVGDALYGGVDRVGERPALHASRIRFDGEDVRSPAPFSVADPQR